MMDRCDLFLCMIGCAGWQRGHNNVTDMSQHSWPNSLHDATSSQRHSCNNIGIDITVIIPYRVICITYVLKKNSKKIVWCNSAHVEEENLDVENLLVAFNRHFDTMARDETDNLFKVDVTLIFWLLVKCIWLIPILILTWYLIPILGPSPIFLIYLYLSLEGMFLEKLFASTSSIPPNKVTAQ